MLHNLLTLLIKGRGGLVEDEDLGVFDDGASDRNPLLLTARQLVTLDATVLLEAFAQLNLAGLRISELVDHMSVQLFES